MQYNSYVFNLVIVDVIRKPKEDNLLAGLLNFRAAFCNSHINAY